MPTYEFRCSNGHVTEQFHRISDAPATAACATCGTEAQRAISGGAGLVFKGSGFYLTDYGKNAHRTSGPSKPSEGGGSEGGKSEGGKSEGAKGEGGTASGGESKPASASSAPASPSGGASKASE